MGTEFWGPFVHGDRKFGDRKSRDQIGWEPFVQGDRILGDRLSRGTEYVGDHLSRGVNFLGTGSPGGPEVGDRKSGDQMGSGPNASQPIFCIHNSNQVPGLALFY
jgi:hypothetical protein